MEGINVTVSGSKPSGSGITVRTRSYGQNRPPGIGKERVEAPAYFFDVYVDGVTGGTATVSITHDSVSSNHKIHHWNGTAWVDHADRKVDGKTVRAEFNVSDLHRTPIVIGT